MAQVTYATTAARVRTRLATDVGAVRDRIRTGARTTPGRLTLYLVVLGLLGALTGLTAVLGAAQRSSLVDSVTTRSGPLAVQAQQLYRSLSDADATAAAAFLTSASEPPELRQRYQSDLAAASAALAAAAGVTDEAARGPVARIAAALPVYSGLIETARTQNRLNLPVGAAYLREASALMREQLLPAANELYLAEAATLADDLDAGGSFPWFSVPLILLTLAGLILAQRYLVRRTQRLVNVGLAVATAAGVVLLLWVGISWAVVSANLSTAQREGSAQVQLVARARIAALQARTDEALTLVARGSGGEFEADFKARLTDLAGPDGQGGLLGQARSSAEDPELAGLLGRATDAVTTWRKQHATLRGLDDGGQYPQAVTLAVGDPKGVSSTFAEVDSALQQAIDRANATFVDRAASAGRTMTGSVIAWTGLTLILVAGLVVGLQRRIAEYR